MKPKIYCTSFCNQPHRLRDGAPVGHECYVLNPKALYLERQGLFDEINSTVGLAMHFGRVHKGVKP